VSAVSLRALRLEPAAVTRPAQLGDVPGLQVLMAPFVETGDLLPRNEYDLSRHIKEYVVVEADGDVVACGSLKIYSPALAEIAGVAVRDEWQGRGLGRVVIDALMTEAKSLDLRQVFALTRKPAFFLRLGFGPAEKEQFPQKVWADCARCPRQACCDEIAVAVTL
jgi:N-acetylglutamate synthase-like GNAT family acetyltransferase